MADNSNKKSKVDQACGRLEEHLTDLENSLNKIKMLTENVLKSVENYDDTKLIGLKSHYKTLDEREKIKFNLWLLDQNKSRAAAAKFKLKQNLIEVKHEEVPFFNPSFIQSL